MKIAFFHELPVGGARRATNEIAKQLKKNNLVDLYIVDEIENNGEKQFYNNVFLYKFIPKVWKGKNWKIRLYKDTVELYNLYNLHKKIARDIKGEKYDLVFVHASKFTQTPFLLRFSNSFKIYYCHDPHYRMIYEPIFTLPKNLDPVRSIYEKLNRFTRKRIDIKNINGADLIVANSKFTQESIRKTYDKESIVSYLGVDEEFFKPAKLKKDIDVLYIGSYQPVDGYSFLKESLRYFKNHPIVKKIMVEDEWIADDKKLRQIYQRSKIIACLAYDEPFGLTPLEAMACGTPVIAVNEGGYKETIKDGETGFLVKRNAKEIADKLNLLLNDENLLRRISYNSRNHIIKNWTWERNIKLLENKLKAIINKTKI